jgi:GT2 family glycosyltransferase
LLARRLLSQAVSDVGNVSRELSKAYRRPWRPAKHFVSHYFLHALSTASLPFSPKTVARLKRSAEKRSPRRFDKILTERTGATATGAKSAAIAEVSLPTSETPLVSVIIPSYGKAWLILQCLQSIADNPPSVPFEVIVADDASGDPDVARLKNVSGLRLEANQTNLGFVRTCNRTGEVAKGDYLFFLNDDTLVTKHWLEPLLTVFNTRPDAGMVGSKLFFADGGLQEAGGIIWKDGSAWNYGRSDDPEKPEYNYVREVDYISGCAILIRRQLWRQLGGFDELFVPVYCEDSDLAFRVRAAGKKVYCCPFSVIVHLEGATNGTDLKSGLKAHQVINTEKFRERWRATLCWRSTFPLGRRSCGLETEAAIAERRWSSTIMPRNLTRTRAHAP